MIFKYDIDNILPRLKGPLREILDLELSLGNKMVEISTRWPMPIVNVWLKKPLTDKYKDKYPQIIYEYLGDPKNWLEQYVDKKSGAMIAAKCS